MTFIVVTSSLINITRLPKYIEYRVSSTCTCTGHLMSYFSFFEAVAI